MTAGYKRCPGDKSITWHCLVAAALVVLVAMGGCSENTVVNTEGTASDAPPAAPTDAPQDAHAMPLVSVAIGDARAGGSGVLEVSWMNDCETHGLIGGEVAGVSVDRPSAKEVYVLLAVDSDEVLAQPEGDDFCVITGSFDGPPPTRDHDAELRTAWIPFPDPQEVAVVVDRGCEKLTGSGRPLCRAKLERRFTNANDVTGSVIEGAHDRAFFDPRAAVQFAARTGRCCSQDDND